MKILLTLTALVTMACGAAPAATIFQDLHDFTGGLSDGNTPYSELVPDSEGRLYGITIYGGADGDGTLYRMTLPTGKGPASIEILHSFAPPDGVNPIGNVLIGADGGFYGVTNTGGAYNSGMIYRVDPDTFELTNLHDFNPDADDGNAPQGGLIAGPNGLIYGTTASGGPLGYGTVFAISPKGDQVHYSIIHAFGGGDNDGDEPRGRLTVSGKNLFGTTNFGGEFNFGTVYELTLGKLGKWSETGLYIFGQVGGPDVIYPATGLSLAKSGVLYGCASGGGTNVGHGAIYSIKPGKAGAPMEESIVYSFGADPSEPYDAGWCNVTVEASGKLIGTSNGGGANNTGTVFTLPSSGSTHDVVYSFGLQESGDAVEPETALVGVANGFYVGVTALGGADNIGTAYRIKP